MLKNAACEVTFGIMPQIGMSKHTVWRLQEKRLDEVRQNFKPDKSEAEQLQHWQSKNSDQALTHVNFKSRDYMWMLIKSHLILLTSDQLKKV